MTRRAPAAGLLALTLLAILPGAACSHRSRRATAPEPAPAPNPTTPPAIHLEVAATTIDGSDPPGDDVVAGVSQALDRYVATAIVAPLASGQPVADLSPAFTASAAAEIAADASLRATVLDEGLPPATREISAPRATAILDAVNGPGGTDLVGARIGLTVHAAGPGLDVDIARDGELVLVAEGGAWKIDVVHLRTERNTR